MSYQQFLTDKVPRAGSKGIVTTITVRKPDNTIYNLTNTTSVEIEFMLPNQKRTVRTATKVNPPGTDGLIRYVDSDDNNKVYYSDDATRGTWYARGIAHNADGSKFLGSWQSYPIGD